MAIATSYNVVSTKGARENLENVLRTVSPQETPIYSTIPQSAAPKATLNEWLVDSLADPVGSGGNIDGADLTISDAANLIDTLARLSNRVATFRIYSQYQDKLKWSMSLLADLFSPLLRQRVLSNLKIVWRLLLDQGMISLPVLAPLVLRCADLVFGPTQVQPEIHSTHP